MTDNELDREKLLEAVQCLRKTLQCTLCHKLPSDTVSAKCGHLFCQTCVDKIGNTKRGVCAICKTVVIKSGLCKVESFQKIVADFRSLYEAIERDTRSVLPRIQTEKRCASLALPDPTSSRTGTSRSELSTEQAGTVKLGRQRRTGKTETQKSMGSEETIKIKGKKPTRRPKTAPRAEPEASGATDNTSAPVFTADELTAEIGAIGSTEKVKDWLLTEVFEGETLGGADFPEIQAQPLSSGPSESSESLESLSRAIPNIEKLVKSQGTSKAGRGQGGRKGTGRESERTNKNETRYKSFTFEATDGRSKKPNSQNPTSSERMFEELQKETLTRKLDDKRKPKASAALAESWSELKQLKKEARPNNRKRKRLNVSIERPSSSKPVALSLDKGDSGEEKEPRDIVEGKKERKNSGQGEIEQVTDSAKKRRLNIISQRTLNQSEMYDFDLETLNRRQVKDIIGVTASSGTPDASKNSSASLEKSANKSNRSRLSLRRSVDNSRDKSTEEEATSCHGENSRPQSKQSHHPDSRPESRLSHKSQSKRASDKFRLSTRIASSTPNISPSNKTLDQKAGVQPAVEENKEKIQLGKDSPLRVSNDFIRNKLSLRRLSSGSSKMTEQESRISIHKLGKLYKPRNRIKFYYRGFTKSELVRREVNSLNTPSSWKLIETRDAQVQTSPEKVTEKKETGEIVPHTSIASAVSTGFGRIEEVGVAGPSGQPTVCRKLPLEELDTENKVHMLPPEDDSQLKYLATDSPSVHMTSILESDPAPSTVTRKTSFVSSGGDGFLQGTDDFSNIVKRYAEKLIVTDSEDQDMSIENFGRIEPSIEAAKRKSPISETASSSVAARRDEGAKTASSRGVTNVGKSPSSNASPRRKKLRKKSPRSQKKGQSTEKPKSRAQIVENYREDQADSDPEVVKLSVPKNKDGSHRMEDSEPMLSTTKHKVVRKLDYSQESGSNRSAQTEIIDKKKNNRAYEKRTFQKAGLISSSESEVELEISLTTKDSLSNSPTITRPGPSQACRRPILSEDLSVVFSSNTETQETKRKRSPSPNSLDNNDLKEIAANWCDDLERSSEEIAAADDALFRREKNVAANASAAHKKPRIVTHGSLTSWDSDQFPVLSRTAIYGDRKKGTEPENKAGADSRSLNNTDKSQLSFAGRITPAKDRETDDLTRPQRNRPDSTLTNSSRRISPVGNIEHLITRGSTFNGKVTSRNSTPSKAKSLEDKELTQLSHNSNKENELRQEEERADSRRQKEGATAPGKAEEKNSTELFESFDADYLNITQEQLLMQEVEDNLVGRKSNGTAPKKSPERSSSKKKERTPSKKEKAKGYQIAQIDSDDSVPTSEEEDIIESTPEKNLLSRKDLSSHADSSQRSAASLKSFMSVDITPIPNRIPKVLQMGSEVSPLVERNARLSRGQKSLQKDLGVRLSSHSTPKAAPSIPKKLNPQNMVQTGANVGRLCFVCSCLSLAQVHKVKAFARMHNVEFTTSYKPEVTHVIVETNESDTAGRTLKYLQGVAHKKWIVGYRWVVDSMSEGKLLPEENYEAVDSDSEEPGPQRSRLSEKGLFDEFAFVCMKPFSEITISQLQDLITSTGGIVRETLEELASVSGRHRVILYNGDVHQSEVLDNWRTRGRALPVQVEWVLSCISQYHLMTFRDYLDSPDSDLASDMGFPAELIVDEDDSATEASTLNAAQ